MSSNAIDIDKLKQRAAACFESSDLDGLSLLDKEVRSYVEALGQSGDKPSDKARFQLLAQLNDFYSELSEDLKVFRGKLANDLHGMQNNKKAIKAYKSP